MHSLGCAVEVNQKGEAIEESTVQFAWELKERQAEELLLSLIAFLKLEAVRTNATKHGHVEMQVRPAAWEGP